MTAFSKLAAAAVLIVSLNAFADAGPRAERYRDHFRTGSIEKTIQPGVRGTRKLMTVLPGVLYRGGGPGGMRPLPHDSLVSLCEAGFSLAVYAYKTGWEGETSVRCTDKLTGRPNRLDYVAGDGTTAGFKPVFLAKVRAVAMDPSRGPVFVHCWNGDHASGELAAIALRQFCGLSGSEASEYWLRHAGGFSLISRIAKFRPIPSLSVPSSIQSAICP